ncbi:MAG: DegQ family serine endoprotease [Halothiobacillaceae bacterium]
MIRTRNTPTAGLKGSSTSALLLSLVLLLALAFALPVQADRGEAPDYVKLVEETAAAVVNIRTTSEPPQSMGMAPEIPFPEDSPFGEMFRHFFGQIPQMQPRQPRRPAQSLGSGFIISEDGYILTNAHVIDGADTITVRMQDQSEHEAEVIGQDVRTDIALLKVDADDLPTVEIGNSEDVRVGEWVLAIGSPFGLEHTATHGIVSAIGRNLPSENYVPFIQTDAPVNPGNSGGPLFNAEGEVIGINSQIYTRSGGYMGLSFAIPIDVAMNVVDQLREHGSVTRGYLGVLLQPVTTELAESFGLDRPRGALIAQVQPDSPADAGGIRPGDIILRYAGKDIDQSSRLPSLVGETPVGERVKILLLRNGKEQSVEVQIGRLEEDAPPAAPEQPDGQSTLGLALEPLNERQQRELGIAHGLVVISVTDGPAARAGVRPNDILMDLNNRPLETVADLRAAISEAPQGRPLALRLLRGGQPMFLAIPRE